MSYLGDFIGLIYPRVCPVCNRSLFRGEKTLCMKCYHHLPRTRFAQNEDNPVARIFWGRVPLEWAFAAYFYSKGNAMQSLIHEFKYRGNKDIGHFLGQEMGREIKDIPWLSKIDCIVPVPLHHKKQRKRGFNQSEIISRGLNSITNIPLETNAIIRKTFTATQTRRSRYDRWQNVERIFMLKDPEKIAGRHILLLDDVITTGATIEACASTLLEVEGVRVSVGAVGCAVH